MGPSATILMMRRSSVPCGRSKWSSVFIPLASTYTSKRVEGQGIKWKFQSGNETQLAGTALGAHQATNKADGVDLILGDLSLLKFATARSLLDSPPLLVLSVLITPFAMPAWGRSAWRAAPEASWLLARPL